jgi:protein-tyrosine-phosphatase
VNRVLFVCTGNVHRSVLAERLLTARVPPGAALRAESAGTRARPRPGMEDTTRAVLEQLGGDGSGFTARPLTARLVTEAALVLGLAREHREAAVRLAPAALRRCFTLKEFVRLAAGAAAGARDGAQDEAQDGAHDEARYGASAGARPGPADRTGPPAADGLTTVVAAAAARRGAVTPVPPGDDDIADPWGRPRPELYACAREIDGAVRALAALLYPTPPAVPVCRGPGAGHWET